MTAPILLVADGPGAQRVLAIGRQRLADAGWTVIDGFDTRPALVKAALAGTVASPRDAASALLAALDGFGLLIHLACDPETCDRLVDDLRRVGPVEHLDVGADTPDTGPLSEDGRAILLLLAEGYTLGEAAGRLALSRRTADRRLAEAREALGVTRTTEAIAIASRRGFLRPG